MSTAIRTLVHAFRCAIVLAGVAAPLATAQQATIVPSQSTSLAGPRVGITFLSQGIIDKLKKENIDVGPVITQFGWQGENRFYADASGFSALSEWIVLVGGLEQGKILPSGSWIIGFRTVDGLEFGVGPNVTPLGAALAFVGGMTTKVGNLNVPINLAIVPSASGVRLSVLTGFNATSR